MRGHAERGHARLPTFKTAHLHFHDDHREHPKREKATLYHICPSIRPRLGEKIAKKSDTLIYSLVITTLTEESKKAYMTSTNSSSMLRTQKWRGGGAKYLIYP